MSMQEVPAELKKLGIGSLEELSDIKAIAKTKFFESKKPKPVKKSVKSTGKKTERQIFVGRIASASDLSKSKVDELPPDEQKKAIANREKDFRSAMTKVLGNTELTEADVTKVAKTAMSVLLDMHVFEKPKSDDTSASSA